MNPANDRSLSKYLSWVLRHAPHAIGLELEAGGWVPVADLVHAMGRNGIAVTAERIGEIVESSDKRRFALSEDGKQIRAQQGHSVPVDLGLRPCEPPAVLFHGTVFSVLPSIREHGLQRGKRHHVHLSGDEDTAKRVGARRGRPVVLRVRAGAMAQAGHTFFVSGNGVWLTESVPPCYLEFPDEPGGRRAAT